jgi:hypothetical protein
MDRSWKKGDKKIFTLGLCNLHDTIGYSLKPSRVFHMLGLFPTDCAGFRQHWTGPSTEDTGDASCVLQAVLLDYQVEKRFW